MKQVVIWKGYNPDRLYGGYFWSIEEVFDDWNRVYSDPYLVEIPDDFNLSKTITGEKMYFRDGDDNGYALYAGSPEQENTNPYLVGGSQSERIKCTVIKKLDPKELD